MTRYAYDAVERLSSVTDPLNRVTSFTYDPLSRRLALYNPAIQPGALQQWGYTPDGLVGGLTDANGNVTTFTPDGFDRLGTTSYPATPAYPSGTTEVLSYDADLNVMTRKTRAGATIAFAYDALNRVCTKTYATTAVACGGSSSSYLVSYAYDLDGRLIGANDNGTAIPQASTAASYVTSYSYDALNRPVGISWNQAPSQATPSASTSSFAYAYDATNRLIRQSANDNSWWSYPGVSAAGTVAYAPNALNEVQARSAG